MSFKPIYWYYGNNKFSSEEICKLKSNIDKIDDEKLTENNNCISTFVYCENDRPDLKYNDMYSKIVENITKNVGIYHNIFYECTTISRIINKPSISNNGVFLEL